MTDKTIPVLDNNAHTNYDYGTSDFLYDLATWCDQWVDDVAFPIMHRALTLYEDDAIRALVFEYSRLKHERRDKRIDALIASGVEDGFVSTTYKLWDRDREGINTALRLLLIETGKED